MLFQVCFLDGNAWVSIFLNRRVVDAKVLRLEGTEVVVRDLHERPLHDLVRFRTGHQRGERHGAVPSAVSVTLAENGVLYVGLADGTVLDSLTALRASPSSRDQAE